MRAPVERRNMGKYYKFHKDRGHDTLECFQLRDQIEGLIQEGYLQEYISRLVTTRRNNANAPRKMALANHVSMSSPNDGHLMRYGPYLGGMSLVIRPRPEKIAFGMREK